MLFWKKKKKKKQKTKAEEYGAYKQSLKNRLNEVVDEFFEELEKVYVRRIEIEVDAVSEEGVYFHCNLTPDEMRDRAKEVKGLLPSPRGGGEWKISIFGVESWELVKGGTYKKTIVNKPSHSRRKDGWWRYFAERRFGVIDCDVEEKKEKPAEGVIQDEVAE